MKKEKIITVDGQTLLDMRLPQIRFVVDGLLPQGLHILAGAAKTGKSWLLLLLSLRVAQGKPFWNLQTEKGTVLSLCLEDSLNRIQQRLMDLTEDAPDNLHFATLSKSLSDGLCEQIEGFITEHPDTNLVIIDTLQKVRENSGESNLYATDYKDIGLLKALADKYHIAVVVVQHLRNSSTAIRTIWSPVQPDCSVRRTAAMFSSGKMSATRTPSCISKEGMWRNKF